MNDRQSEEILTELHAAVAALPDLTMHWVGFISIAIFVAAYALVIAEESTHLRKFKPVIVAGGMLWFMLAGLYAALGLTTQAAMALRHILLEYGELLLFLLVAMTYVNSLEERRVFEALRSWLVRSGFRYRPCSG